MSTKITMLEKRGGSQDGIHVQYFERGETYEVTDTFADMFVRNKWAVLFDAEQKMEVPVIENKMDIFEEDDKSNTVIEDAIPARDAAAKAAKGRRGN